ncbi:MAG: hypothetical protein ACR5LC_13550 [Symbiopectobacterium sp.]|uniref:hypothetical protein n=1 Tax=Symbiopectobacterium sp. TaxID=2952789 RepID=UPI003F3844E1
MSETVTAFGAVQPAPYIPGNDDLVLELCALSREFRLNRGMFVRPGIFTAVNNVSLRVRRGETLGLVGDPAAVKVRWQRCCWGCCHQPRATS